MTLALNMLSDMMFSEMTVNMAISWTWVLGENYKSYSPNALHYLKFRTWLEI